MGIILKPMGISGGPENRGPIPRWEIAGPIREAPVIIVNGVEQICIYTTHALSLAGLGVHVSSLSDSMNAIILAQVELSQNSIHCFFFPGPSKGWPS